jgi:hypothetical protein
LQPGGHRFEPGILHQPLALANDWRVEYGWRATTNNCAPKPLRGTGGLFDN